MFFATSDKIASIPIKRGIKTIILRMRNIPAIDATALRAIEGVYDYCQKREITLLFSHVNEQPLAAMQKANFYEKVGEEHFLENIDEALAYAEKLAEK